MTLGLHDRRQQRRAAVLEALLTGLFIFCKAIYGSAEAAGGYAAICAVAKNENRYVREWVEYHKCLGKLSFKSVVIISAVTAKRPNDDRGLLATSLAAP